MTKPKTDLELLEGCSTKYLLNLLHMHHTVQYRHDMYGDPEPRFTREQLKSVLATRPHIPNKEENKAKRQAAAKASRGQSKGRNK